ncbi:MAG: glycosyltransferase [Deltaproteobacteria bacterium]|nr:glycosyltransferase [Deltaproteobacteria bacterium]
MTPSQLRVLYTACDRVPGPTAGGARLGQVILTLGGSVEADGLTVKSEELAHIQRLGTARMMRVPAPEQGFVERVSAFQRALKRQLEGDSYDLCHAADAWAGAVAAQHKENAPDVKLITELTELPTQTLTERHPQLHVEEKIRQIMRRGEAMVLQRSDALVVDSVAMRTMLVQSGVTAERVHVIPAGVDDTVFFASTIELRLHEGQFVVLYAGAPDPARGLGTFLAALKTLPAGVRGAVTRQRPREPQAEAAVAQAGLTDRVTFVDAASAQKLASAFQSVDAVVLLPSAGPAALHAGHVPRRLVEAMACRRAVVVTDLPGVREVVQDRQNGMLVPAGNPKALADAVGLLFKDPGTRGRLAQRAQESATLSPWSARASAYRKLYTALLGQPFETDDEKKPRPGSLAERARAMRAAKAPGVGIARDETARPASARASNPPASVRTSPPTPAPRPASAAPPPAPAVVSPPPPAAARAPVPAAVPPAVMVAPEPAPSAVPAPSVLAPPLAQGSIPERSPFGSPTTGGGLLTAPVLSAPVLPPVQDAPGQAPAAFLLEPTPMSPPSGTRADPADAADPWGGDTLAVSHPPSQMEETSSPPQALAGAAPADVPLPAVPAMTAAPAPVAGAPAPGAVLPEPPAAPAPRPSAGGPGMRSLALLDSLDDDSGPPVRSGGDETERLELTPSHVGALYGRKPMTLQAAGIARFGSDSEQPTTQTASSTPPAPRPAPVPAPPPAPVAPPPATPPKPVPEVTPVGPPPDEPTTT